MVSTATIYRSTGRMTQDETTGLEVPEWEITHLGIPVRVAGSRDAASSRTVATGGVEIESANRTAHFPASIANLADGDLIHVTAGENAGAVLRIIEADWQDQASARRVPVVAEQRPEEW